MDWEILRDVIAQEILNPGPNPGIDMTSWSIPDVDDETVEFLVTELKDNNVIIRQSDYTISLEDVGVHSLFVALRPHFETLLVDAVGDPLWFCTNVHDGYINAVKEPIEGPATPTSFRKPTPRECELCERSMPLTQHHLYPRSEHEMLVKRGIADKHTVLHTFAYICRPCHTAVHQQIDSPTLAKEYHSVEALLTHEGILRWVKWAAKQKSVASGHQRLGLRYAR